MKRLKSIYFLIGELSVAASQWIIISLIAKNYSLTELGIYTYYLAIIAPVTVIIQMQHRTIYVTEGIKNVSIEKYFNLRIKLIILVFLLIAPTFLITETNNFLCMLSILLWKSFELLSDLIYGYWQKKEEIKNITISKIFKSIFYIVIFVFCVYSNKSMLLSLISLSIVSGIALFLDIVKSKIHIKTLFVYKEFTIYDMKKIVKISIPLAIASMLNILYINMPKYVFGYFKMTNEVAIFSSISYILVIGNMIINSIIQVKVNHIAQLYKLKEIKKIKKESLKFFKYILLISTFILIFVTFFGDNLLAVLYNEKISEYYFLLAMLIFGSVFNYFSIIIGVVLTAAQKYKLQPVLAFCWCCVYAVSSILLIKYFGLYGSGISFIISSLIQFFSIYYFYNNLIKEKIYD
ncbi:MULTISPECIES: lipopolysaccharide biosynthesis protein [Exiguobacterium]|uniref:Oligosaccharide flippase family protein n=1 Tax=Exiguobacterium acetylicum TaxID=41170 RepID=A0ABX8G8K3_EXIAC|nr:MULTISPECIES: oligosaccharide flippase family protein [Exiguobacterium]QWB29741.1 oligosaccharide flippase family protein [Exiguobacterium acetylicum]